MNQGEALNINIPTHTNIKDTSRSTSNRKKLDLNNTEIRASVRSNKYMWDSYFAKVNLALV